MSGTHDLGSAITDDSSLTVSCKPCRSSQALGREHLQYEGQGSAMQQDEDEKQKDDSTDCAAKPVLEISSTVESLQPLYLGVSTTHLEYPTHTYLCNIDNFERCAIRALYAENDLFCVCVSCATPLLKNYIYSAGLGTLLSRQRAAGGCPQRPKQSSCRFQLLQTSCHRGGVGSSASP